MLVFRAVPLSFSILWQLVLYAPVVFLSMILIGFAISIYSIFLYFLFGPVVSIIFAPSVYVVIGSIIPTMIGARIGLQRKGVRENSRFGKMYWPILGYGAVEGLVATVLIIGAGFTFLTLTGLTLTEVIRLIDQDFFKFADKYRETINVLMLVIAGVLLALRAALLVTFAGASVNADPSGRGHTPFAGFGAAFVPMLIIVVFAYCVIPIFSKAVFGVGSSFEFAQSFVDVMFALIEVLLTGTSEEFGWADVPYYIAFIAVWFWTFSLQSAAAVLVFVGRHETAHATREITIETPRMEAEDVRALWKSRM